MNWGMNFKNKCARKNSKHTINNKLIKNLQGMNQGTNQGINQGNIHTETFGNPRKMEKKRGMLLKKRTKIEEYSKSVNRLPLTTYCQVF
jgi:hypothetical protein